MSIIQWNCRGYRRNYGDLCNLITTFAPICICIQESLLGDHNPRPPKHYTIETFNPNGYAHPGNGLATLVRKDISKRRLDLNTPLQAMALRISFNRKPLTVCNIYIHPNAPLNNITLQHLADQLPRPFLILGDFNARHRMWGDEGQNQRGGAVERFLLSDSACLLNTGEHTHFHVQTGTSTAIDLSLCSAGELDQYRWSRTEDTYGSDHHPIVITINRAEHVERESRPLLRRADWKSFEAMTMMDEDDIDNHDIDTQVEQFVKTIRTATSVTIPHSGGSMKPGSVPWWSDECTQANATRKRALRRYQRTKNVGDKIAYNRARAYAQVVKDVARKQSWQKYVSTLTKDTPMNKIWQRINKMNGKYSNYGKSHLMRNGEEIIDQGDVAAALAEHFSEVSSGDLAPQQFQRMRQRLEQEPAQLDDGDHMPYNEPISMIELHNALSRSTNSSPGEDKVSYALLKRVHYSALRVLLLIYNNIWLRNSFPKQWQSAIILPFPKPGKNPANVTSYRPIVLTSCLSKLLERIVHTRLMKHLEYNNLVSPIQFGFRRNHCTTDALMRLQKHVLENRRLGRQSIAVFFYIKKAYDTIWRFGLLRDLHLNDIKGHLAHFIKNFLSNRTFRVKYGTSMSPMGEQVEGVPQGSVLSCALFLMAMNGIASVIPPDVQGSLFVDDVMICASSARLAVLERRIQGTINRMGRWATEHGLEFSTAKTVAVHFRGRQQEIQPPSLRLYGEPIPFKSHTTFLGMTVDCSMSWSYHLRLLKIEGLKRLQLLKTLSHRAWGADRTTMLRVYRATIRAKLDYGCIVYQTANQTLMKKIDPVHNAALRLCTGAFRSSPVISLYAESGEEPLYLRRKQLTLQYIARVKQTPLSPAWHSVHREQGNMRVSTCIATTDPEPEGYRQPILRVMRIITSNLPTWRIPITVFCQKWLHSSKSSEAPQVLRALFREHMESHHQNTCQLYTDGSKSEEGVGCAVTSIAEPTREYRLTSEASIYTAELTALVEACRLICNNHNTTFTVFSDSKSALEGIQQIDSPHPIIHKIHEMMIQILAQGKNIKLCWVPSHVNIPGNERADEAAGRAASSQMAVLDTRAPAHDYYPRIRKIIRNAWQTSWEGVQNNKLRDIKDTIKTWNYDACPNRLTEIVLCRLRIGHTLLTHRHLMEHRPQPFCGDCLVPLTVVHILTECPEYTEIRRRYYPALRGADTRDDLRNILSERPGQRYCTDRLMKYLTECNLTKLI